MTDKADHPLRARGGPDPDNVPRLLGLVRRQQAAETYARHADALGVRFVWRHDLGQMLVELQANAYHGLILDVPSLVRDKSHDKGALADLEVSFPVFRARLDEASGAVTGVASGEGNAGDGTLKLFIAEQCAGFIPRRIRNVDRVRHCLNVIWSPSERFDPQRADKTCVMDISRGGCFLWSLDPAAEGSRISLVFHDCPNREPGLARVAWSRSWGEKRMPPGMGLTFIHLPEAVLVWLMGAIKPRR